MKHTILISLLVYGLLPKQTQCQHTSFAVTYQTIMEEDVPVLKGFIHFQDLLQNNAYNWFNTNLSSAKPSSTQNISTLQKADTAAYNMVVFLGTWCPDTQQLLPIFYKWILDSHFPERNVQLLAVDRNKKTLQNWNEIFAISSVPTFIVFKNGKELGRVVEYGKTGDIITELANLFKKP